MIDVEVMARIAEGKVQEAIEEGKFDNLPGKGKPLVLDDDLVTPPHLRLANRILRNANVLPDWIQVQKDIETERKEVADLRIRLARENVTRRTRVSVLPEGSPGIKQFIEWHTKSRASYLRHLKSVNTSILKFCMMAPSTAKPFIPYRIEAEMEAFDADFPSLSDQSPTGTSSTAEESDSQLSRARALSLLHHRSLLSPGRKRSGR